MPEFQSARDSILKVYENIAFHPRMGECQTFITVSVMNKLAVLVRLGTSFIDRLIKSMYSVESKIVPHHSTLVPISMVCKV